jgi:Tfp pilus assembly protein PilF
MNLGIVYTNLNKKDLAIKNLQRFIDIAPPQLAKQKEDARKRIENLK